MGLLLITANLSPSVLPNGGLAREGTGVADNAIRSSIPIREAALAPSVIRERDRRRVVAASSATDSVSRVGSQLLEHLSERH